MLGQSHLGEYHPVIRPQRPDWQAASEYSSTDQLLALTNEELAEVDPLAINLIVAQGIPEVGKLDIPGYQKIVNEWAVDLRDHCLPNWETHYHQSPEDYDHHLWMFRLGMITQYLERYCHITYNPELMGESPAGHPEVQVVTYTNPGDLFLHGIIDTRMGTCGNMAALHVAIGWRLGWPVTLACAGSHFVMRYDDGESVYNLEATAAGQGGFLVYDDEHYIEKDHLPSKALTCGSDLKALTPREMLGTFFGLRARIYDNTYRSAQAEQDSLQARALFPSNRQLCFEQLQTSLQRAAHYFAPGERGHPSETAAMLTELCRIKGWEFTMQSKIFVGESPENGQVHMVKPAKSSSESEKARPTAFDEAFASIERIF